MSQGAAWSPLYLGLPLPSHQVEEAGVAHLASEASFPSISSDSLAHHLAALHATGTNCEQQQHGGGVTAGAVMPPMRPMRMKKSSFGAAAARRRSTAVMCREGGA